MIEYMSIVVLRVIVIFSLPETKYPILFGVREGLDGVTMRWQL